MLAEMITLQLFYMFETAIEDLAAKIVCGAKYADGVVPVLVQNAGSIDAALIAMRTFARAKPKGILKWNRTKEINGNVKHLIPPAENFCSCCRVHSARLNEIRIVRNHIAHGNKGTRAEFARVVQRRLGALPSACHDPVYSSCESSRRAYLFWSSSS
jgi:hypothetical protein